MKFKLNMFTHYNCILLIYNIYYKNYLNQNKIYAINCCLTWIVFYTFHLSLLVDSNSFKRIREKNDISYLNFHTGNIILHIIPYCFVLYYPATNIYFINGIESIFLKLLWCFISSNGTMNLSHIYLFVTKKQQKQLYFISITTGLITPIIYNNFIL